MDDLDLLTRIKADFKESRRHSGNWRSDTRENYQFVAGGLGQWDAADVDSLREQQRPVITFNRIGPYIDAISGNEINARHTILFMARTIADRKLNEDYTEAIRWVRDNCYAEDEESDAFVDVLISGMGWIETSMEYDTASDGKIVLNRVDPGQMFWDSSAKKRNLEDRKWQARSEWLPKEEVEERWPDKEISPGTTPWIDDPEESGQQPHNASLAFLYRKDSGATEQNNHTGKLRVIHYQWWEHRTIYRVADPMTGKMVEFSESRWNKLKNQLSGLNSVKQKKRVYQQTFLCGDTVLETSELKCNGFTFKCITGKRDKINNTWYGLVQNMKDPQRWANKFFSQILHIINSNAKGGLMAETGAFTDPKKAEEAWADPNAVILLKNGGLSKIKERGQASYPAGLDKLMAFAVGSIPAVSGINLETMGMVDREQAGILEQERKKSTFTILAPFFDSLRRYRKEEGRLLFYFINEYIPDAKLKRIITDQGEQYVPLNRLPEDLEFDMIVEESPSSPNQKQETWKIMENLIPALLKVGMPLPPDFFDYSPLPPELADKMKASMQKKLPPEHEQAMQQMQQNMQQLAQENETLKQNAQLDVMKIRSKDQQSQLKSEVTMEKIKLDYGARLQELQAKNEQHIQKLMAQANEQQRQFKQDMAMAVTHAQMKAMEQSVPQQREFEVWKTKLQEETKRMIAELQAQVALSSQQASASDKSEKDNKPLQDIHIHMPSGRKKITLPDGRMATSEDI